MNIAQKVTLVILLAVASYQASSGNYPSAIHIGTGTVVVALMFLADVIKEKK